MINLGIESKNQWRNQGFDWKKSSIRWRTAQEQLKRCLAPKKRELITQKNNQ